MSNQKIRVSSSDLPGIPDKLYFTIGEVGRLCDLKPHVLRYWEQEFPQLSPSKRRGNRRYYQRKDVVLVRQIRELLYEQGYTIEGARQQISGVKEAEKQDSESQGVANINLEKAISDLERVAERLCDDSIER